jgi:hypothetical protein
LRSATKPRKPDSRPANDILSFQPRPLHTKTAYYRLGSTTITSIARIWAEGDSGPEGRCRLCEQCTASHGLCIISVRAEIARPSCPLFSTLGRTRQVSLPVGREIKVFPQGIERG